MCLSWFTMTKYCIVSYFFKFLFCANFYYCLSGDHCEECQDGWYGNTINATNAIPNDSSPFPYPSGQFAFNQFAKTFRWRSTNLCELHRGPQGRYCKRCMDGYFGLPRVSVRLSDLWNLDKRHSYVVKSKTKIIKMTHQNIEELRLKPTGIRRNHIQTVWSA